MKKTPVLFKCFYFFIAGCLFLFNFSCGLDVYEVIPPPVSVIHQPDYNTTDHSEKYFSFYTEEKFSLSAYTFLGTEVYYKIYNNVSTMTSERSTLESLASSTTSANSADRMISSYSYQLLTYDGRSTSVLIPKTGENREVYIRLSNYMESDDLKDFTARISIGVDDVFEGDDYLGVPLRTTDSGSKRTFDFGRSGDTNSEPVDGDIDLKYSSSSTEDGCWYVQLFAVGVARDTSFALQYSSVLFLGAVTIDASSEDN
ncbi:MAG: hypothetical protein K5829_08020 [Treponema sp.]|nr:hypothetical protein [Treponema sp.]